MPVALARDLEVGSNGTASEDLSTRLRGAVIKGGE